VFEAHRLFEHNRRDCHGFASRESNISYLLVGVLMRYRPSVGNSSSQVPSKAMDGVLKELEKICAWNLCMRTLPGLANSMFTEGRDNKCKELVVSE